MNRPEHDVYVYEDTARPHFVSVRSKLARSVAGRGSLKVANVVDEYVDLASNQANYYYTNNSTYDAYDLMLERFEYERTARAGVYIAEISGAEPSRANRIGVGIFEAVALSWAENTDNDQHKALRIATSGRNISPHTAETAMGKALRRETEREVAVLTKKFVNKHTRLNYHLGRIIGRQSL